MTIAHRLQPDTRATRERRQFDIIAAIARADAGLMIPPEKAPMVFARITKRIRQLGLADAEQYCALVLGSDGTSERRHLISALTTNVTGFFRERHHFDFLRRQILPDIVPRAKRGERIRIWSAGCSSGPEPYSIAMVLLDAFQDARDYDIRILATDIDAEVLDVARAGRYGIEQLAPLPDGYQKRFLRAPHTDGPGCPPEVAPELKQLVRFKELNLLAPWPMRGTFDLIFCRNVVIYFDQDTQMDLWSRFAGACKTGGHLFLGHSERLPQTFHGAFRPVATTTYLRTPASPPEQPPRKES
ncbi:CheR family methyltransferase [Tropicimonas sediminicola]|uniref:Chemotaxis protein methyltransferase n=1 Tax=Tropicimonas sediminicola TaxID=1031541 RepID=A0A239K592_9RHOB|nr:protein-glutamate O-methyltransferase [Tropicimonas sediminicola]SNT13596.1 chemotaxis protein methyltransferase CheR [Tropicimonas sediminicola]